MYRLSRDEIDERDRMSHEHWIALLLPLLEQQAPKYQCVVQQRRISMRYHGVRSYFG